MLMPPADEDMDAEGEAVNETDDVVGLHQHPVQLPEPHHTHELTTVSPLARFFVLINDLCI